MTKNWLEYDWKTITKTNIIFWIWPNFTTPTNINLTQKKFAGAIGIDRSPSPGSQNRTGWDTCPASLRSSTRKRTSGTDIKRTPEAEIVETTFSFPKFRTVLGRFRFLYFRFFFVPKRFQERKYPLFKKVVYFWVPEIKKSFLFVSRYILKYHLF